MGQRAIMAEEPARACGFNACLIQLKDAITTEAESLEAKRLRDLHDITFPATGTGKASN
jgi:hypothetical protein